MSSLTQKGQACKLCKKRGGLCHMHTPAGMPKTTSPKTATRKRAAVSPKTTPSVTRGGRKSKNSPQFPFLDLYKDIRIKMMLGLPRKDLDALCRTNKEIRALCKSEFFQNEYDRLHVTPFMGRKIQWVFRGARTIGTDELGNQLEVKNDYQFQRTEVVYRNSKFPDLTLSFAHGELYLNVFRTSVKDAKNMIIEFLSSKGRSWRKPVEVETFGKDPESITVATLSKKAASEFKEMVSEKIREAKTLQIYELDPEDNTRLLPLTDYNPFTDLLPL